MYVNDKFFIDKNIRIYNQSNLVSRHMVFEYIKCADKNFFSSIYLKKFC